MKNSAKILLGLAALAGPMLALTQALPVQAQPQQPQPNPNTVCLDPQDIRGTQAINARTLLFHMRDGTVWKNTLAAPCPQMMSHSGGFSQTVHADRICSNQQTFTILDTGEVCRLGTFSREN
jgi:hypothetical protein